MKQRVTFLISKFGVGGAENMTYELAKNIDTDKFDVSVLCYMCSRSTPLEQRAEKDLPITYLNQSGRITLGTILRVMRAIYQTKPDVVHAHLGGVTFGAIWSILFRKNLVITLHAKPQGGFNRKRIIESLVRMAVRMGKVRLVAVSKENEVLIKDYYRADKDKCTSVNNGIDLARYYTKEHKCFTIVNAARHDDNKNQAALLRCFAKLHEKEANTKLLLLGDGPNHEALKQLAEDLGVKDAVTFTGNVSNTEDYYAVSDLYVQSSFTEALPISVLEAMAAGLPVVSTNVGGLPDVVQDNGILVPAGDEDALFSAILEIYQQTQSQRDAMKQASLRIVEGYSSEGMARAYEKIYNELCK